MIFKLVYIYFFLYLLCNMYDIYLFGRKYDFFSCKFVFIFILNEFVFINNYIFKIYNC